MNKVVITGMGIWSCLGQTLDDVRQSLFEGKSGIIFSQERKDLGFRSALCANVPKPDLKPFVSRNLRQFMPEEAQYAYMATKDALEAANIDQDFLDSHEVGIIYGNDSVAEATMNALDKFREFKDTSACGSGAIFQSMNSTVNMNLSTIFHLRGVNFTLSAACASGSHSIGIGYLLIKQGLQDLVLCGGAQETNYYSMASFDALGAFSVRMDDPARASRPFDKDRDGLVPGGGAAALVLEEYGHAKKRGATILCEVTGYGFSSNGGGIAEPSEEGCIKAISRALADAGTGPEEVDYINAHATSTKQGDMYEALALDHIFRGKRALISSTKSMTGHECWMAGASEIVYSILMMQGGFVAPNINFENPDEYSQHLNIAAQTVETKVDTVLSNSFGFGGTNAALVIKKL